MDSLRGFFIFIAKVLTTKKKDDFIVRLGANLVLSQIGLVGPLASIPSYFLRSFLGFMIEMGVYQIDLALDSLREGQKLAEFKIEARKAYEKATAKLYTEKEKEVIREQYKKIIEGIAPVGPKPKS